VEAPDDQPSLARSRKRGRQRRNARSTKPESAITATFHAPHALVAIQ